MVKHAPVLPRGVGGGLAEAEARRVAREVAGAFSDAELVAFDPEVPPPWVTEERLRQSWRPEGSVDWPAVAAASREAEAPSGSAGREPEAPSGSASR
eukprot:7975557-Lingulodinium_polyedra.AAC.1